MHTFQDYASTTFMTFLKFILLSLFTLLVLRSHAQSADYIEILSELQQAQGEDRAILLLKLCNYDINNDQELTKKRALEALKISKELDFKKGIGGSLRYIGLSHHYVGELDSARIYYSRCKNYYDKPKSIGWSYYNIASLFEYESKYDSALHYLDIAENLFVKDTALVELGSAISMRGTIANIRGNYSEAAKYFYDAMTFFEEAGDQSRKADMIRQLSSSESSLGNYDQAISYAKEAHNIYTEENDTYYQAYATNAIGSYFLKTNMLDSAEHYLEKSISSSKSSNNYIITMASLAEIAEVYLKNEKHDKALSSVKEAESLFSSDTTTDTQASHFLIKGKIHMALHQPDDALQAFNKSLEIAKLIDTPALTHDVLIQMTTLYENQGNYRLAYEKYRGAKLIMDSLNNVSQSEELQDILVKYETEKKDVEIDLLAKQTELDASRKKSLWSGLVLLALTALAAIYSLIQRSQKKQALLSKEKAIELEKRKHAEEELEYKKKELTAKALQLASKNEFLHSLEQEIGTLQSSIDGTVGKTTQRISRMINNDQLDDTEWNQFGKEFSSIHQTFMDKLKAQYGDFSTTEWRLISLMKMSLSSKDIANILRISPDGVKKARYRLRKKMELASEVDIQDYLISYRV